MNFGRAMHTISAKNAKSVSLYYNHLFADVPYVGIGDGQNETWLTLKLSRAKRVNINQPMIK